MAICVMHWWGRRHGHRSEKFNVIITAIPGEGPLLALHVILGSAAFEQQRTGVEVRADASDPERTSDESSSRPL
jgi:hypothetical protein